MFMCPLRPGALLRYSALLDCDVSTFGIVLGGWGKLSSFLVLGAFVLGGLLCGYLQSSLERERGSESGRSLGLSPLEGLGGEPLSSLGSPLEGLGGEPLSGLGSPLEGLGEEPLSGLLEWLGVEPLSGLGSPLEGLGIEPLSGLLEWLGVEPLSGLGSPLEGLGGEPLTVPLLASAAAPLQEGMLLSGIDGLWNGTGSKTVKKVLVARAIGLLTRRIY